MVIWIGSDVEEFKSIIKAEFSALIKNAALLAYISSSASQWIES